MSLYDEAQKLSAAANLRGSVATPKESATYVPRNGTPRPINVIASREPAATPEEFAEGKVPVLEVIVENDSTYGIAASEFDKGDVLTIATRWGGTAEDHLLPAPTSQCAATITFRIGK